MDFVISHNKEEWNAVVTAAAGAEHTSFLQSWEWGAVQEAYGRTVYRLQIEQNRTVVGAVQILVMPLALGRTYLFSPRGPIFTSEAFAQEAYTSFRTSSVLAQIAQKHRSVFWRYEPVASYTPACLPGALRVSDVEPSETVLIPLSSGAQTLLSSMKQKTRYNIRLAEKKEVSVKICSGVNEDWLSLAQQFWTLVQATSERHGIRSHDLTYYTQMITQLGAANVLDIAVATHEKDILAMHLLVRYGNTMTYLHGASSDKKKNYMAPYLLQWHSLVHAQKQGCAWYDLYGISTHGGKLSGVTRFKTGFGGTPHTYPGTYEFPLSQLWYTLYKTAKQIHSPSS